tara:strand:+ start:634 stop:810 length:177 start_codon:yes stop_codon:yes gene_type:complete
MGRTYRFNKKDGRGSKPRKNSSRSKKKEELAGNKRETNYDVVEQAFERFSPHGKPRKP